MQTRIKRPGFLAAPPHAFLRRCRDGCLIIGVLALGYVVLAFLDATLFQASRSSRFDQILKDSGPADGSPAQPSPRPSVFGESGRTRVGGAGPTSATGSTLGRIEIPRIGLAVMILEGVDEGTLRRGIGHIPGTPLPGQEGNAAIAGHRDTFFRALRNIRKGDEILLTTLAGSYRYQVRATKVVDPEDTDVLDASRDHILTLVTCYPFNFIGSAPQRFIVRAQKTFD